ncbi:MAG: hypothetical protein NT105_10025 [Verrucomicrobia bacterium]|nr:hypothetical protein [Verrucomicrobiota bacterium]
MRLLVRSAVFLLLTVATSPAHWTVDETSPEWCQRGNLHWAIDYSRVTKSDVELMAAAHQNLDHGASYDLAETAAYAASRGLYDLIYVCSRTFVVKDYEKHSELKQGVVRAFDGSEVLAYNNPVRRYGCVNCPEWKAFVIGKVDQIRAKRTPAGIFFDNEAWFSNCYCPVCREKFHEYTRRHYGREMDLPERVNPATEAGRAARLFLLESQTAYHKALLEYCHQCKPRLLSVPNTCSMSAWPIHGIEEGVTDLPFYELSSHPPFGDNLYAYKLALAAGHGRNVGNLMYLPPDVAAARGKRVWNEGMHHFFNPASPLAKEFALAISEGAACDATYVANYNLFPSLPIVDTKDPFNVNIHQTMNRYYDFLVKNRALYLNANQGAEVAILHSVPTDLMVGAYRRWARMAEKLNRAGIPYEVIMERDLKPKLLRQYKVVMVAGVRALAESGAAALLEYAKNGGRVVLGGECGLTDERGEPQASHSLQELRGGRDDGSAQAEAQVGKGRVIIAADDLTAADGAKLRILVTRLLPTPGVSVQNPTGKLSVNVLTQPRQKLRKVHLVNYDFSYDKPENVISDDDQSAEARSYLANTAWRIRKVLKVPDPSALTRPVLEIVGSVATSKKLIRLVVNVNGRDVATVPADDLHGTLTIALPAGCLVAGDNEIVLRVEGQPSAGSEWYQVMIDENTTAGRSFFSKDSGKTWTRDDLSEDREKQRGEFMIRLTDPDKRPAHQQWEQMCHVNAARGVRVFVRGEQALFAVALSPTASPQKLDAKKVAGGMEFTVDVDIYTVLVITTGKTALKPWLQ